MSIEKRGRHNCRTYYQRIKSHPNRGTSAWQRLSVWLSRKERNLCCSESQKLVTLRRVGSKNVPWPNGSDIRRRFKLSQYFSFLPSVRPSLHASFRRPCRPYLSSSSHFPMVRGTQRRYRRQNARPRPRRSTFQRENAPSRTPSATFALVAVRCRALPLHS